MFFDNWDWENAEPRKIPKSILWEYDTDSPDWDWNEKATIVVKRVLQFGRFSDYMAMFQLYGGQKNVRDIIKRIPSLEPRLIAYVCTVFGLKEEELKCCTKKSSIQRSSGFWNS